MSNIKTNVDGHWVGTWSCAPYALSEECLPIPSFENKTLRQILRCSIGGNILRIKFSNKTCATPVTFRKATIAISKKKGDIVENTAKILEFKGSSEVTIAAHSTVISDPIEFALTPDMIVAITIHYGKVANSADITAHKGSRGDSYLLFGDQTELTNFSNASVIEHWFHINTIEVLTSENTNCIAVLGDSITDGYGLSGGLQNRWTDLFSRRLLNAEKTKNIGVLNLGIGGTLVSGSDVTAGINRYKEDVLAQNGVSWIIVFYGTNDIANDISSQQIIDAYKKLITQAHNQNIKIFGTTLLPFKGHTHYSPSHEQTRKEINEWIRTSGIFDEFIDFDKAIRDSNSPAIMSQEHTEDWLHPNAAGYKLLGEFVDLKIFS